MAVKLEYTYENIRQLQIKEMKSSSLTRLEPDFYEDFLKHLHRLELNYGKISEKNANKTEAVLLSEEIRKLKGLLLAMYERRERKIIFLAQVEARGGQPNTKNLTHLERDLYEQLVNLLKRTRVRLEPEVINEVELDGLRKSEKTNGAHDGDPAVSITGETKELPAVANLTDPVPKQGNGLVLVQILEDIQPFQDDKNYEYHLKKEDVLSLPEKFARILVKRGAARAIDSNI